jgi:hypothetical protein
MDNMESKSKDSNGIGFDNKASNTQHNCGNTVGPIRGDKPKTIGETTNVAKALSKVTLDSNTSTLMSHMKALEVKQQALEFERARLQHEDDAAFCLVKGLNCRIPSMGPTPYQNVAGVRYINFYSIFI